jgi:hypothetical protein
VISDIGVPIVIAGTGGLTYNQVEGALRDDGGLGTVRWNKSWVVNDADPTRLLLGTDFLYESFDRGDTFTSLGGLAKNAKNEWIPANAIGIVHSYAYGRALNPDVIYVGASNKLLLRESGQGLPKVVESYPGSTPVGIAVAGSSWQVAYVLDNAGRVWRTNDAGATAARWSELTSNLLSLTTDLRTIATLTPKSRFVLETLFVPGQGGVFVASADAITGRFGAWRKQGTGFPNAIITGLQYSTDDDVLVAGTLGRASWLLANVSGAFTSILTTHVSPAVTGVADYIYWFATTVDGRIVYNRAQLGHGREGWYEVAGLGRTEAAPTAGAVGSHLFVAIKGLDGNLLLNQADLGGNFGQWFSMDFFTDVAPAVCGVGDLRRLVPRLTGEFPNLEGSVTASFMRGNRVC